MHQYILRCVSSCLCLLLFVLSFVMLFVSLKLFTVERAGWVSSVCLWHDMCVMCVMYCIVLIVFV